MNGIARFGCCVILSKKRRPPRNTAPACQKNGERGVSSSRPPLVGGDDKFWSHPGFMVELRETEIVW